MLSQMASFDFCGINLTLIIMSDAITARYDNPFRVKHQVAPKTA